jgi:hypothetical protein
MLIKVYLPTILHQRQYTDCMQSWNEENSDQNYTSPALDWLLTLLLQSVDIPGLGFGQSEYFPYVYYKINVDMMDTKI